MKNNSFTIEIQGAEGNTESLPLQATRRSLAIAEMKRWLATNKPTSNVYLGYHRHSDGQRGYLNQDGSYAITGKPWSRV